MWKRTAYLDLFKRDFKAKGLVVVRIQSVLFDCRLLLLQPLAVLHQVDLHIWIWGVKNKTLNNIALAIVHQFKEIEKNYLVPSVQVKCECVCVFMFFPRNTLLDLFGQLKMQWLIVHFAFAYCAFATYTYLKCNFISIQFILECRISMSRNGKKKKKHL